MDSPKPLNWPTAAKINARIAKSEKANEGRKSLLHGKGESFIKYGEQYGINPAIVVAISQRECQLGADGSALPTVYNFGGITDPGGRGPCGRVWVGDRYWAKYCTVEQGIEAMFKIIDGKTYRKTDGTVRGVMTVYSPPFENDWKRLLEIFSIVGKDLGVTINSATPVYVSKAKDAGVRPALSRVASLFKRKDI